MSASMRTRGVSRVGGVPSRLRVLPIDDRLDASGKLLADVEALGVLTVIPVVAKPIRTVPETAWHTLAASLLAAAHKLLAVDDAVRPPSAPAQLRPTPLHQSHAQSLHKTLTHRTIPLGQPAEGQSDK